MQLRRVDKASYRATVNRVIVGFVGALALLSVALGSGLIALFGQASTVAGESTGNFHLNLIGVLLALALCSAVLHGLRRHPKLADLFYVFGLKQRQAKIYSKMAALKAAAEQRQPEALSILLFYYRSQQQVYQLDDNTLTLSEVNRDCDQLEAQMTELGLPLDPVQLDEAALARF
ncbi:DUF3087 family protein [Ferrimonas marina]|uniref:DUF3087 domain-containing protein n=1 Tax=Ferrimonas marina TaxID=299255 RepID=A0A1M5RWS1_9GAMM|nr:DUF3087 family protein [Ferrimonas marina]SHH30696.1 Protein of unknown function [Ferrimonas marina]